MIKMTVPFENDTGNIVRKLARKSLKSEKRRNLMVVIAVALASCLICFSIVMALSTRQIEKNHVEDTYEAVYTRITEEDVSTLKGLDDFSRVGEYYMLAVEPAEQGYNASYIYCDEETMYIARDQMKLLEGRLPQKEDEVVVSRYFLSEYGADYEELAANNGVVVTDAEDHLLSMFYGYTPAIGDVLTFESMDGKAIEVTVMGIAKPSVTSGTGAWGLFTLTEELADQLYPDIENREAVWNVHTSEDSDALRASIFSLLENPVLTVFSRADHAASLESQLKTMTRGVYLLLAFLFVFSMVNLVNTLMTNLLARQQEIGILQSVGMTGKQVSRMLIAECLWYAGVTVLLSVGIGGTLGWILDYVISSFNIFGELSYQFPLMETVVFVLALLVVTGIFSVVAVRYSKRLSLVDRIKTME